LKTTLLSLINVSKSFNTQVVINNLSIDILKNEFISILGQSGVGKSTLLNLVFGFIKPDKGVISFHNHEINKVLIFQEYNKSLFPWFTVYENMKLVATSQEEIDKIDFYLELVNLISHKEKYPWQLSGGMQQRVAIARSLLVQPDLLLMDEPFGSIDHQLKSELEDELKDLRLKFNLTIMFVTHDIESAIYLSDRIIILKNGIENFEEFRIDKSLFSDKNSIKQSTLYKSLKSKLKV